MGPIGTWNRLYFAVCLHTSEYVSRSICGDKTGTIWRAQLSISSSGGNRMKAVLLALALVAGSAWTSVSAATDSPACDRACLKTFTDAYFDALATHDPSGLPVAPDIKFTENGKTLKLGQGFWKTAGSTTYRMEIFDPEKGGAAVQAVVTEGDELAMFLLRLKVVEGKIREVETLLARKGASGQIWAPQTLKNPSKNFTLSIRKAEQNSRLELMATANAYWRAFETNGTPDYHPAPFLPDANRFENGLQTTNRKLGDFGPYSAAEQFDRGLFQGRRIYDRRFPVVDTERGVVLSIVRFGRREGVEIPNYPKTVAPLVAEIFAVKSGRIQEIQVVMLTIPANDPTGWDAQ
jgi:hypothetical protein